jgi:hypothetical protein
MTQLFAYLSWNQSLYLAPAPLPPSRPRPRHR